MAAVSQNILFNTISQGFVLNIEVQGDMNFSRSLRDSQDVVMRDIQAVAGRYFGNKRNAQGRPMFNIEVHVGTLSISCSTEDARGKEIIRYVNGCIPGRGATLSQVKEGLSMADRA